MYDFDTYKTYPFARLVEHWTELGDVDCYSSTIDHFTKTVDVDMDNVDDVIVLITDAIKLVRLNIAPDVACAELGIRNPTEEELRFLVEVAECDDSELDDIIREAIDE